MITATSQLKWLSLSCNRLWLEPLHHKEAAQETHVETHWKTSDCADHCHLSIFPAAGNLEDGQTISTFCHSFWSMGKCWNYFSLGSLAVKWQPHQNDSKWPAIEAICHLNPLFTTRIFTTKAPLAGRWIQVETDCVNLRPDVSLCVSKPGDFFWDDPPRVVYWKGSSWVTRAGVLTQSQFDPRQSSIYRCIQTFLRVSLLVCWCDESSGKLNINR